MDVELDGWLNGEMDRKRERVALVALSPFDIYRCSRQRSAEIARIALGAHRFCPLTLLEPLLRSATTIRCYDPLLILNILRWDYSSITCYLYLLAFSLGRTFTSSTSVSHYSSSSRRPSNRPPNQLQNRVS